MNKDEAFRILEILKDIDFNYPVPLASTLNSIRVYQLNLLGKALNVLTKEFNEK